MIRLIGILAGSAIAAAFLIVVLGMPEFRSAQPEAAVTSSAVTESVTPSAADEIEAEAEAELAPVEDILPAPTVDASVDSAPLLTMPPAPVEVQSASLPEPETAMENIEIPAEAIAVEAPAAEQHWYAFWSPFRSQVAADGFVSELQRTTGLDYRVVKLKPGVYEVAFAYTDDSDVETKLAQIASATGLDLSGG